MSPFHVKMRPLHIVGVHTPANASPRHRWSSRHSSGPKRIATPFSVEDLALSLTSYSMPVLTGAFWIVPHFLSLLQTAKRQGQHPLSFFKTLFTTDTATAQATLYNDCS